MPIEDMMCFATYSATMAFNRFYKPMLDRMGLTYPQFLVLSLLWREDDQAVGRLGERLFLESNTLTPLIKRLETADLVTRTRDAADERVVRVRLTEAGRALAVDAGCLAQAVMEQTNLTPEAMAQLRDGLITLRDQLRLGVQTDVEDGQRA
jgi:DNA-binding MarR family transcriptional regulator